MKFTGSLVSFEIDMSKYEQRLHEELSEEIARAATLWLKAVLDEIPVWSGASWATFTKLSRAISATLAISVDSDKLNRISYGRQHGDGALVTDRKNHEYFFEYSTDLRWLVHNEYNTPDSDPNVWGRLKKPGPYFFQRVGQKVFDTLANEVRLPSPWKSLVVTRHRI